MKVQIIKGVMIKGQSVFPTFQDAKKNTVVSIVDVSKAEAIDMIHIGQAKAVKQSSKVTVVIKDIEPEEDALDEFFGEEDDE